MTRWEMQEFGSLAGGRPAGCSRRRLGAAGVALAVLLLGGYISGSWKPFLPAHAALWPDFFSRPLDSGARPRVQLGVSYSKGEGLSLQVFEDTPVKVEVDGGTVVTRASLPRLEKILDDAGVQLGENDRAEARIVSGDRGLPVIRVVRVRKRVICQEETIPSPVRRVQDLFLAPGETRVCSQGEPGVLLKRFEVTTENGQEVSRRELAGQVIKEPVPRMIAYGVRTTPGRRRAASRGDLGERVRRVLRVVATAYTHSGEPTASGVMPYVGGVAVDPAVIPLGSRLYIDGYGPARAVDTGGLIRGNRVDLFFDSAAECYRWGRREVNVYVLD